MSRRPVVVAVLLVVVLWGTLAPAAAAGDAHRGHPALDDRSGEVRASAQFSALQAENNTTVRHRDPAETSEEGDVSQVKQVLADQMSQMVVDCSEGVQVGEYDACEKLNGSYSDSLSKFVEVTGGGGGGGENESETFRETRNQQQNYTDTVREYRTTYEKYQQAIQNGNTARARRLARKLLDLRSRVNRQGDTLRQSLNETAESTTVDTSKASNSVKAVSNEINESTEEIERSLFEPAVLELRRSPDEGSYVDPLPVEGQVRTPNGTVLGNATVVILEERRKEEQARLNISGRIVARTTTNESGHFRFDYRPATVRTGNQSFTVRYLPRVSSKYLAADDRFAARIRQTEATVTLGNTTGTAAFREPVVAEASLVANGTPVVGVPLTMRAEGRPLAIARTDANGTARIAGRLPLAVPTGAQRLHVAYEERDRAIITVNASRDIEVQSTGTELSVRVVQIEQGQARVRIRGRLRTVDGVTLGGQRVGIRVDDQRVTTLRTKGGGKFRGTINVSSTLLPDEPSAVRNHTFTAVFESRQGINIRRSEDSVRVPLQAAPPEAPPGLFGALLALFSRRPLLVSGAFGGLLLAITGLALYQREGSSAGADDEEQEGAESPGEAVVDARRETAADELVAAQRALAEDAYERAVLAGYAAARRTLDLTQDAGAATHWEFYRDRAAERLDDDRLDALRRLTEAFERTQYADERPERGIATEAVDAARAIVGDDETEEMAADGGVAADPGDERPGE